MDINQILIHALKRGASDVHLKHGAKPVIRRHGQLEVLGSDYSRLTGEEINKMATSIMNNNQKEQFETNHELDMGYGVSGVGRFRVNVFQQRGSTRVVIRNIPVKVPNFKVLRLPPIVEKIASFERGLVLVTGVTGSGKSTTMASIIDYINHNRRKHIITIEDPIEYLIADRRSLISQRELGADTPSFASAMRAALRQDPDVILIGEMRDQETIDTALLAAETGHLVISTLHTADTQETINRILLYYEQFKQLQVRAQLAATLKGVICQRLARKKDGSGVVPAVEVMINNTRIKDLITDPKKTALIHDAIEEGFVSFGMQSFDQSLMQLISGGIIDYGEALRLSTNPEDFALRYKGIKSGDDRRWKNFEETAVANKDYWGNAPPIEIETLITKTPFGEKDIKIKEIIDKDGKTKRRVRKRK